MKRNLDLAGDKGGLFIGPHPPAGTGGALGHIRAYVEACQNTPADTKPLMRKRTQPVGFTILQEISAQLQHGNARAVRSWCSRRLTRAFQ